MQFRHNLLLSYLKLLVKGENVFWSVSQQESSEDSNRLSLKGPGAAHSEPTAHLTWDEGAC